MNWQFMNTYLAVGLAVLVGSLTTVQSAINTELGKHIGGVAAALVSFTVGTATLVGFYLVVGEGGLKNAAKAPVYLWVGGFLGAAFVYSMIRLIPIIGATSVVAGVIAGQLLLSIVIDQFGWFGLQKIAFDWTRGLGVILLLAGVKLLGK